MLDSDHWNELGRRLDALADDQARWSQATFGTDQDRGPLGALRHLEKEARETQEAPGDSEEYADCFLLILDAARRAGISPLQLIEAAQRKMVINRGRTWPRPVDDNPVEHVR
jgi:hypothetical protein